MVLGMRGSTGLCACCTYNHHLTCGGFFLLFLLHRLSLLLRLRLRLFLFLLYLLQLLRLLLLLLYYFWYYFWLRLGYLV